MATRSMISKRVKDGTVKSVYSHWDGYPSHNGRILLENYNTSERVDAILELGSVSSLAITIQDSVFFGRDRGESEVDAIPSTMEDARREEYNYLFDLDNKWYVIEDDYSLTPIENAIENDN